MPSTTIEGDSAVGASLSPRSAVSSCTSAWLAWDGRVEPPSDRRHLPEWHAVGGARDVQQQVAEGRGVAAVPAFGRVGRARSNHPI